MPALPGCWALRCPLMPALSARSVLRRSSALWQQRARRHWRRTWPAICVGVRTSVSPRCPPSPKTWSATLPCSRRGAPKPATVARRVASLATAHGLSGLQERGHSPTSHVMVRAALKGLRRRRGAAQRQAAPLRFGASLDPHTKGFTLTALLGACGGDLQGLRDGALMSLGYDAGLRVSELVAVTVAHIDPHSDGSALLFIPSSKTDQEGQGAWGWLSADTMRRVGAWLVASAITEGPVFRRVGVDRRRLRAAVPPMAYEAIPGHTRHWQEKLKGKKAELARTVYTVGTASLSRQGINGIYRRVALSAFDQGLVEMPIAKVEEAARALSSHSLRVGLTQDLAAAGEDAVALHKICRPEIRTTTATSRIDHERRLGLERCGPRASGPRRGNLVISCRTPGPNQFRPGGGRVCQGPPAQRRPRSSNSEVPTSGSRAGTASSTEAVPPAKKSHGTYAKELRVGGRRNEIHGRCQLTLQVPER